MKKYRKELTVTSSDLDDLQHVNNVRYLEWVQLVSKEHWEQLTSQVWEDQFIWVVKRHQITYHRPAKQGDNLMICTYVPEASGAISKRKVEIHTVETDSLIAECLTEWVLLDARTGKPTRIPLEMQRVFV
ncbi:MAG: acyl-CoA thioesterase [Robiginitalea sp.]|jgi:acyl-CoA thioester hydrolase